MNCRSLAVSMLLAIILSPHAPAAEAALTTELAVEDNGKATDQWLAMLRKRLPSSEFSAWARSEKQLSAAEKGWAELIGSRVDAWENRLELLAATFAPEGPPERVRIVMGNRGGDDAFTHDASTIGFDLSALQAAYGDAMVPENLDRIDRIFDHEYTHLMQKAWLADHPYAAGSPLHAALLDIWLEGLGNYRSLSARWRSAAVLSASAREALAILEPRFAARMSALACASSEHAEPLMRDLSKGRFDQKWGALPCALWLEAETNGDPEALRRFVLAGPDGVWDLARRHLSDPLRAVLEEARLGASICSAQKSEAPPTE